jgi:hypothetical protein
VLWYIGFGKGPLYAGTNIRQGRFEKLAYESKRMSVAVSRKGEPGGPGYDRTYYKDVSSPYKDAGLFGGHLAPAQDCAKTTKME